MGRLVSPALSGEIPLVMIGSRQRGPTAQATGHDQDQAHKAEGDYHGQQNCRQKDGRAHEGHSSLAIRTLPTKLRPRLPLMAAAFGLSVLF